jgi:cyclopropane fatty-acyl-phospholipid synthase-like methyltransferase
VAWQRLFFALSYRFGRPRWDTGISPPELVEVVEGPAALPAGRALDLGCGTGTNACYLASHGWQVTGVDFVPAAIGRARERARGAGLDVRFLAGDVTRLVELGVEGPFDLVVDIGCFHGIATRQRAAYARSVAAVTRSGATLMMFAFARLPARLGFRRAWGAPEDDVRRWLEGAFDIVEVRAGEERRPGAAMRPAWYRMVRR